MIEPGRVTVLTGRNGAGKSTTLQAIAGLTAPSSGRVTVAGVDVADLDPADVVAAAVLAAAAPGAGPGHRRATTWSCSANLDDLESGLRRSGIRRGAGRAARRPGYRARARRRRAVAGSAAAAGPGPRARVSGPGAAARRAHRAPGRAHRGHGCCGPSSSGRAPARPWWSSATASASSRSVTRSSKWPPTDEGLTSMPPRLIPAAGRGRCSACCARGCPAILRPSRWACCRWAARWRWPGFRRG